MAEHKCVLTNCCCGCTLKTGAWVTAILFLILSIINAANSIYEATSGHNKSSWGTVIISVIILIISILLMYGIKTEKTRFIWIWVYTQMVMTILWLILLIVAMIGTFNIVGLLIGLITAAFFIYFILVVRSYAIELESGGVTV